MIAFGFLSRFRASRAEEPAGIGSGPVFRLVAHPLIAGVTLIMLASVSLFAATEPKRVLVVHSFGSVAPPFMTFSTAFEAEL